MNPPETLETLNRLRNAIGLRNRFLSEWRMRTVAPEMNIAQ